jgi:hypothetical protein
MVNMEINKRETQDVLGTECVEPLIAQLGHSTTLRVPQAVRKEHPNWKKQNPRAFLIVQPGSIQLTYEWKADNGVITHNNED